MPFFIWDKISHLTILSSNKFCNLYDPGNLGHHLADGPLLPRQSSIASTLAKAEVLPKPQRVIMPGAPDLRRERRTTAAGSNPLRLKGFVLILRSYICSDKSQSF